MKDITRNYDIIVVGAGHSGIEAALAAARMGAKTLLCAIKIEAIGRMSCNPTVGGPAKGHTAREIDALGGEIGAAADSTGIHFRMLNQKKGPAVWSPRTQNDRHGYARYMRQVCENQDNLFLVESQISDLLIENDKIKGVVSIIGRVYHAPKVILANGTFLNGVIHVGNCQYSAGRAGEPADTHLSVILQKHGHEFGRFKTGTPPRIYMDSVDFSQIETQPGDENPIGFSHFRDIPLQNLVNCYITHTTPQTHALIQENLPFSSMYGGYISGTGPRYCPSIEDKIVKFADKQSHHIFIEPEGLSSNEAYVNGFSNSLPAEVQEKILRTITGLENAQIIRYGYAIEYDYVLPTQLYPTLESKLIKGLYFAGQVNGTSGYEEAAAQGIVAGINATLALGGGEACIFDRTNSYIGVLIDDLVTKGTFEPYRLFTSRAEYRLSLRQDNADDRLMPLGYKLGLVPEVRWQRYVLQQEIISRELSRLKAEKTKVGEMAQTVSFYELLKRPEIEYADLVQYGYVVTGDISNEIVNKINVTVKYEGYLKRQNEEVQKAKNLDNILLPADLDMSLIQGIATEAREKILRIKPQSVGQASRIPGVNFADIQAILIYLKCK